MKPTLVTLFLVTILSGHLVMSATDWMIFAPCLRNGMGSSAPLKHWVECAAVQMAEAFDQMKVSKCNNCDRYFHCKGNSDAVRQCLMYGRAVPEAVRAAEVISDCPEFWQGGVDANGIAEKIASRFGRNGGHCERQYLCRVGCKFDPSDSSCKPMRCKNYPGERVHVPGQL